MKKMRGERMRMAEEVKESHREETRGVGEYREVQHLLCRSSNRNSSAT